jgi:GNAT superfamily N-acetyltransferase
VVRRQKRKGPFVARLRIRRARLTDLEDLVRHRRAMWAEIGIRDRQALDRADTEYRSWTRKGFRNRTLLGWIVEDENKNLAGSGCLWLRPSQPRPRRRITSQPYLLSMYTEPNFRGKGVASRIVDEAKHWSKKKGFPELALHASTMGRRVYSGRGFKRSWEMRARLGRLR